MWRGHFVYYIIKNEAIQFFMGHVSALVEVCSNVSYRMFQRRPCLPVRYGYGSDKNSVKRKKVVDI